ncbi:MAG: hypothetical protein AB1656_21760 [Candidatus Omnitrophota bacterium]
MASPQSSNTPKHHLKCVVCGSSFGAEYDPSLKAYPVYHPKSFGAKYEKCEANFFRTLLRLYLFIIHSGQSLPANQILTAFDWRNDVSMNKEMICWCLGRGLLSVDNFNRIEIPLSLKQELKDFFRMIAAEGPDAIPEYIDDLKRQLRMNYHNLRPVPPDQMPFKMGDLRLGETTLFDKIDTSKVQLRREKRAGQTEDRSSSRHRTNQR